ncbi:MAG: ATP-binding protein [bacterium]|nr:ATP-binding protein [bacterium]
MMTELSLNVLDITNNSIAASASLVIIHITISTPMDLLTIQIKDNGNGMTNEQLEAVVDPFFTTRTTRKVGLGVPFFKFQSESTGGTFHISSTVGEGTTVDASFVLSHIDRMPLGDITSTIHSLITCNLTVDFDYIYTYNDRSFELDTRTFRTILKDIPLNTKEVSTYIKEYLSENKIAVDGGAIL